MLSNRSTYRLAFISFVSLWTLKNRHSLSNGIDYSVLFCFIIHSGSASEEHLIKDCLNKCKIKEAAHW